MQIKALNYSSWRDMDMPSKVSVGKQIAARSSEPKFEFVEIARQSYCGRQDQLAIFEHDSKRFVLITANEATIGFDVDSFIPTVEQLESYEGSREDLREPWTLHECLKKFTTRPRTVNVKNMLVECTPEFPGRIPADRSDPEVQRIIATISPGSGLMTGELTAECDSNGHVNIWREREVSHKQVVKEIAAQGFRLPTSDEWEYLCAGGVTTLYRWGNDNPPDKYPTDTYKSNKERGIRRTSTGPEFFLHWEPNCFLLDIAKDTYECEIVSEPGVKRGGDGGGSVCGGAGFFLGWTPLATAYYDEEYYKTCVDDSVHSLQARRVFDL